MDNNEQGMIANIVAATVKQNRQGAGNPLEEGQSETEPERPPVPMQDTDARSMGSRESRTFST